MKKGVLATLVIGLLHSNGLFAQSPWYVMAEMGVAKNNVNRTDVDKMLVQEQLNAQAVQVDDSDSVLAMHLGYQVKPHLAVELGYMDLGQRSVDIAGLAEDVNAFYNRASSIYPEGAKGLSLALASAWATPYEKLSVTGRFGYFDWRGGYKGTSANERVSQSRISGIDVWFGVSLDYQFEQNWQASINLKRVNLQRDDNNVFTVGLHYRF